MPLIVVDVESDGPTPGIYSMISFGAVVVDEELKTVFSGKTAPLTETFLPGALASCHETREAHLTYEDPKAVMERFCAWVEKAAIDKKSRAVFVSDNPAFDWQFINHYLIRFCGKNPFGHSARRIGDWCAGLERDWGASSKFKKMRKTAHTHDPVDDAMGNAEALIEISRRHRVKLPGVPMRSELSVKR